MPVYAGMAPLIRILALFVALVVLPGITYWALYSDLGVFLIGNRYWVQRAATSTSFITTRVYLRRVLSATQYGANVVEARVRALPDRTQRARLFGVLVDLAPNASWRDVYLRNLTAERTVRR